MCNKLSCKCHADNGRKEISLEKKMQTGVYDWFRFFFFLPQACIKKTVLWTVIWIHVLGSFGLRESVMYVYGFLMVSVNIMFLENDTYSCSTLKHK